MASIGYVVGTFMASILLPVILLIIFGFTPLKRRPEITYGVTGVMATLTPFLADRDDFVSAVVAALLAALFFCWGYARAVRKPSQ